ncbi:tripartite tricarboxylate transporter substrate binding protein [Polynucleobacter sp. IMCC30063]|uniref:Bug family tripartite tricarboxylate transporter substrate binding protein n=1 Tax=unclassified Polynucleobacter TaxID=2640945 RepID=UPI001F2AC047|nr:MULTISPECIES: tripartite tricarboxylate transporter substrate binding protein [unclassified Polynucleobacter]MCE7505563.1 tripartite tricarboxylate transporter substrate binding protein [Polynucleobacter sp. IMCC30063]MCE7529646.1 tripartite tricarboxylate transporter substrate binding protein [Polynucleobacter sp. IMCC 29146]
MLLNQLLSKLRTQLAFIFTLFGGIFLLSYGPLGQAQSWPDKPIKLIIPFAPGGTTDILGRALAQQLSIVLKQNVIIENRAGAGGNIGAEAAAKAPADGYTLILASGSMMTVNPFLYKKMPVDYAKDLTYITTVAGGPMVLAVNPKLPVNNVKELIALAKTKNLNFGSAGIGSQVHMAGENFIYAAGIPATHIPYKGEALAMNDLIAGQIDFMLGNFPATNGFVKSGQVKAFGVTSKARMKQLPNVPTVAEAGVPGFENNGWFALAAPMGTPNVILEKIYNATGKALESEAMQASLEQNGYVGFLTKPKELEALIKAESATWDKVIKARNIQAQ